jgi:hypothetical protein
MPKGATRAVGRRRARAVGACTGRRRQWRRATRLARGGEARGLLYAAQRVQGDEGVMVEMLAVLRRLEGRAYGGDTADRPPVRCVRARTAALTSGCLGRAHVGARDLGTWRASGGAWPGEARSRTPEPAAGGARRSGPPAFHWCQLRK